MANFLDKFKGKPPEKPKGTMAVYSFGLVGKPLERQAPPPETQLPRAAAIYGAAAAIFAVLTVFYLIKGIWFTGLVMIVPTLCLGGFAYHNMKS